jgi:uncharacterized protein with von Willebrand factor type A (vWA) domain
VLDESGSMSNDFQFVREAFNSMLGTRRHLVKDKVSVILFGSSARLKYIGQPITSNFELDFRGGGTNFDSAFSCAKQAY